MSKVAIVTDSNSGITQADGKEMGVFVLPMPFYIDDELFFEEITLTQEEFYQKMESDADIKTSQPAPGDVMKLWDDILKEYDEIVHIPMSSGLSGSCETAMMLAEEYDGKVKVVNNQRISVTQRRSVMEAKALADAGKNAEETGIVFGAPSKTFNIAGLVSSWAIIKNERLRKDFYAWLDANEFNDPTFISTIATEEAYNNGEEWLKEMIEYINGNIEAVDNYLTEYIPKIKVVKPQASFLVWLDCRELDLTQKELVSLFTEKACLALNDGEMFGKEGVGYMRMNIGTTRAKLIKSLEKLRNAVNSL